MFYVLEIQSYFLPTYYANLFAKVFGYLELNNPAQDWRAVAIFLARSFEPKETRPYQVLLDSPQVTRIYLDELPAQADPPLALGIWEMVSASQARVRDLAPKVLDKARRELPDTALGNQLVQLVKEFLIQKFANLSPEELRVMFNLADIRDTRVFKDALEEGREEGLQEGLERERKAKDKIARRLLAEGLAVKKIAQIVGLPVEKVRRLAMPKE